MGEQRERLLELGELPTVSIQVLPYAVGAHAAMGSSFIILRLAEPADAQVVYLEDLWSADYVDRPAQVTAYNNVFDRVAAAALDAADSARLIEQVRREMS
jgi:hypothetical protein